MGSSHKCMAAEQFHQADNKWDVTKIFKVLCFTAWSRSSTIYDERTSPTARDSAFPGSLDFISHQSSKKEDDVIYHYQQMMN